jgi:hypothetical protein
LLCVLEHSKNYTANLTLSIGCHKTVLRTLTGLVKWLRWENACLEVKPQYHKKKKCRKYSSFFFLLPFLQYLRIKPRVLRMLDKCSATQAIPPYFCFRDRVSLCPGWLQTCLSSCLHLLTSWDITAVCHHAQLRLHPRLFLRVLLDYECSPSCCDYRHQPPHPAYKS